MRPSVILATYNQPAWLEKVLWGYAVQTHRDFELIVADDGSGPETARVIERVRRLTWLEPRHIWHEDRGFRKCEILNHAVQASASEYLIFSDGDCIPRADFVETHVRLAEPRRFLSGGYLKLPAEISERITLEDVRTGRFADLRWLRQQGWRPGRRALRLLRSRRVAGALDALSPTRRSWNGHNASTWRAALLAVNGFEAEMQYGGEDRALGERLQNYGIRGKQIRYRAPVLHLEQGRAYINVEALAHNQEIARRIARMREVRARWGIAELPALPFAATAGGTIATREEGR